MSTHIDIFGASGAAYRFTRIENAQPPTAHSGIFLYVSDTEEGPPAILHVGQAENLMTSSTSRWAEAQRDHGATALYTRLHVASAARNAELADILAAITPVMN